MIGTDCASFGILHSGIGMASTKILRLLERGGLMTRSVAEAASALFTRVEDVGKGQKIRTQGESSRSCHLLVDGIAFRHLDTEKARQITTFLLPGDWSDIHGLFYPIVTYSITTLTACQIAVIDHAALSTLMEEQPTVARGLWLATLREAAIEREWLLNVGQRTDQERIAHLLSELVLRFRTSGLCQGQRCQLPLGNLELAQCTGCPPYTVGRVLKGFESMGLLLVNSQDVEITDLVSLKALGAFEPSYLELPSADEI